MDSRDRQCCDGGVSRLRLLDSRRLRADTLLLLSPLQKLTRLHDFDTSVVAQAQQILVPGQDVFRTRLDRALENTIIWRIFLDDVQHLGWDDAVRKTGQPQPCVVEPVAVPLEFLS